MNNFSNKLTLVDLHARADHRHPRGQPGLGVRYRVPDLQAAAERTHEGEAVLPRDGPCLAAQAHRSGVSAGAVRGNQAGISVHVLAGSSVAQRVCRARARAVGLRGGTGHRGVMSFREERSRTGGRLRCVRL